MYSGTIKAIFISYGGDFSLNDQYGKYADFINQKFSNMFDSTIKSGGKPERVKLLYALANIYRRWYYSSLLENTYITPANLFEALAREYGHPSDLTPIVTTRTPVNYTGLTYSYQQYNKSQHPVVADLRTFVDLCRPNIVLGELDQMSEETAFEISKHLHMNDPCYAMYLLSISLELGLLVKIPSIHANHAQPIRGIEKHLSIPDKVMFDKIVKCTITYASRSLSELIPLPVPLFDQEYLVGILKEPIETDAIFQRLYDTIGVDIEDLIGLDIFEEMDMLDMAVISGTYLLGIVLDKFFLTPFGHYLKLIRPVYMLPFDFENEISIFLDAHIEDDDLGIAFYAPCSCYYLTEMGLEYFDMYPTPDNYLDIANKLKFASIAAFFTPEGYGPGVSALKQSDIQAISKALDRETCIYSIKVKYQTDPRLWLNIDVSDINSLHRLYLELAYYFDLDKNAEYTFFPDDTENPFIAYASPNQIRRSKKTSDTTVGSLTLDEKQTMVLTVSYPRMGGIKHKEKWTLEVVKVHTGKTGQTYPAVTRLGKALREYFEWG